MKTVFLVSLLGALTACGNNDATPAAPGKSDPDVVMHTDFDSLTGWLADPSTLTKEQAHSGQYSIKIDQNYEYSITYSTTLGQLSSTRPRALRLDAWAYLPSPQAAQVAFVIKQAGTREVLLGERLTLTDQVHDYGKWVKISQEYTLPPATNYSSTLDIFLGRATATGPAYLDDLQLTALH